WNDFLTASGLIRFPVSVSFGTDYPSNNIQESFKKHGGGVFESPPPQSQHFFNFYNPVSFSR
ncbi:MAG: hypothetical protein J5532_06760, partial [Lachnospiraceae bacterium]|nr:hypothetical protein [Lachnospiraceae bacterium]